MQELRRATATHGWVNIVVIVSLLSTMLALLVTSLMISRNMFSFLPLNAGYVARLTAILPFGGRH